MVQLFKPQKLPYIQAIHGENVSGACPRHAHSSFCIGLVLKKSRLIYSQGTSTVIATNKLFVINPGQVHSCKSKSQNHSYFVICVEPTHLAAIASQIDEKSKSMPYFQTPLINDKDLAIKLRAFFPLIKTATAALERESALTALLSTLILKYGKTPPSPAPYSSHDYGINKVREFIRSQYAQNMTLTRLSELAGLSPFYLHRLFLQKTGFSPKDYLVHWRIKKAREALLQGNAIASVALETGFVDQSHFTRCFKRLIGITPGDYVCAVNK